MKNVKDIVVVALGVSMALDQAKANDGKIDLNDIGLLIPVGMKVPEAINDAKLAKDELMHATPEERAAFNVQIAQEYNIADDEVEAVVECALECVVALGKLAGAIEKARAKKK